MKLQKFIIDTGISELARQLKLSRQAVFQWTTGERKPSLERCRQIEALTRGRLTRKDLRPDLFV